MNKVLRIAKKEVLVLVVFSIVVFINTFRQIYYLSSETNDNKITNTIPFPWSYNAEKKLYFARSSHYLMYSDYQDNLNLYSHTLHLNPIYIQAWISFAEFLADENKDESAVKILNYIDSIVGYSITELWDMSLLAIRLNEPEVAGRNLVAVAQGLPWYDQYKVYKIADQIKDVNEYFVANSSEQILISYLGYLRNKGNPANATNLLNYINTRGTNVK